MRWWRGGLVRPGEREKGSRNGWIDYGVNVCVCMDGVPHREIHVCSGPVYNKYVLSQCIRTP
jgi:hypothetical protein